MTLDEYAVEVTKELCRLLLKEAEEDGISERYRDMYAWAMVKSFLPADRAHDLILRNWRDDVIPEVTAYNLYRIIEEGD